MLAVAGFGTLLIQFLIALSVGIRGVICTIDVVALKGGERVAKNRARPSPSPSPVCQIGAALA